MSLPHEDLVLLLLRPLYQLYMEVHAFWGSSLAPMVSCLVIDMFTGLPIAYCKCLLWAFLCLSSTSISLQSVWNLYVYIWFLLLVYCSICALPTRIYYALLASPNRLTSPYAWLSLIHTWAAFAHCLSIYSCHECLLPISYACVPWAFLPFACALIILLDLYVPCLSVSAMSPWTRFFV